MMQRDYLMRMIEDGIQAIARALGLVDKQEFAAALSLIDESAATLLGPLAELAPQLEATSLVSLMSVGEMNVVTTYAAMIAARGSVYEAIPDLVRSGRAYLRALELLLAASVAGASLRDGDVELISRLTAAVSLDDLSAPARTELQRFAQW